MTGGSRLALRYSFSNNEAVNSNATGNALVRHDDQRALEQRDGEGPDEHGGRRVHVARCGRTCCSSCAGSTRARSRPRDANALIGAADGHCRQRRDRQLPRREHPARLARPDRGEHDGVTGGHSVKVGTEYNHVCVRPDVRLQPVRHATRSTAAPRRRSRCCRWAARRRTGSRCRAQARDDGQLSASDWQPRDRPGDRRVRASSPRTAGSSRANFTLNYGLRWEGAFNPTPDANNDFLLNALDGVTFPIGRTVDPTQIPNQLNQCGPRVGFAWESRRTAGPSCAATAASTTRARRHSSGPRR